VSLAQRGEDFDLAPILLWIAFLIFPLIARILKAAREKQAAGPRPPTLPEPRQRVEELEREGDDAWRRLLRGEEPEPVPEPRPVPVSRVPPPSEPAPTALDSLGRGLAPELPEDAQEAGVREEQGAEAVLRQKLAPELAGVPGDSGFAPLASLEPALSVEELPGEPAAYEPRWPAAILIRSSWAWRSVVAAEVLGPPLALRGDGVPGGLPPAGALAFGGLRPLRRRGARR
jgi:hypothetical protein